MSKKSKNRFKFIEKEMDRMMDAMIKEGDFPGWNPNFETKLKKCPFCKSKDAPAEWQDESDLMDDDNYTVVCSVKSGGCGASSGYCRSQTLATIKWNTRGKR
jgi:hypothetical protein